MNQMVLVPSCSQSRGDWGEKKYTKTNKNETYDYTLLVLYESNSVGPGEVLRSLYLYISSLPMQEMQVQSLGQKDPLGYEMATHSSIPAWKIPWKRSLAGYSPWVKKSRT